MSVLLVIAFVSAASAASTKLSDAEYKRMLKACPEFAAAEKRLNTAWKTLGEVADAQNMKEYKEWQQDWVGDTRQESVAGMIASKNKDLVPGAALKDGKVNKDLAYAVVTEERALWIGEIVKQEKDAGYLPEFPGRLRWGKNPAGAYLAFVPDGWWTELLLCYGWAEISFAEGLKEALDSSSGVLSVTVKGRLTSALGFEWDEDTPGVSDFLVESGGDGDEKSSGADGMPDWGAYSIRDGRVFKHDTEIDCEVYEMPQDITSVVERWAVFGTETSDVVTEADTGVWFWGLENDYFIHLDSEREYQGLFWSPQGDRFVLARGNEAGAEVTYELWTVDGDGGEGMNKKAEFSGVRGEIRWLDDGTRFVFTRIDSARETPDGAYDPYALKLSAVLYDSASETETVMKEANDKQNFRFSEISDDGENIALIEESVKSPKDWGREGFDAGKIEEREIKVPVPDAGK
jgi:hypothetical protein